jgi:hypothetical protein
MATRRSFLGRAHTLTLYNSRPPLGAVFACTGWWEKEKLRCMQKSEKRYLIPLRELFFSPSPHDRGGYWCTDQREDETRRDEIRVRRDIVMTTRTT